MGVHPCLDQQNRPWPETLLVAFPLEEGGNIVIEIDELETGGTVRAGREDTIEKAKETFEEAPPPRPASHQNGRRETTGHG